MSEVGAHAGAEGEGVGQGGFDGDGAGEVVVGTSEEGGKRVGVGCRGGLFGEGEGVAVVEVGALRVGANVALHEGEVVVPVEVADGGAGGESDKQSDAEDLKEAGAVGEGLAGGAVALPKGDQNEANQDGEGHGGPVQEAFGDGNTDEDESVGDECVAGEENGGEGGELAPGGGWAQEAGEGDDDCDGHEQAENGEGGEGGAGVDDGVAVVAGEGGGGEEQAGVVAEDGEGAGEAFDADGAKERVEEEGGVFVTGEALSESGVAEREVDEEGPDEQDGAREPEVEGAELQASQVEGEEGDGGVGDGGFFCEEGDEEDKRGEGGAEWAGERVAAGQQNDEAEEEKDGGEDFGAADDVGDGFGMDGVDRENEGGDGGNVGAAEQAAGEHPDEARGAGVEEDVDEVVAERVEVVRGVVEGEGKEREGAIEAVTEGGGIGEAALGKPPVAEPDGFEVGERLDAGVFDDEGDVVVGEAVGETGEVTEEADRDGQPRAGAPAVGDAGLEVSARRRHR